MRSRRWGFQVVRMIARNQEQSAWSRWPRATTGIVSYFGTLDGIEKLPSTQRLELLPYASGGLQVFGRIHQTTAAMTAPRELDALAEAVGARLRAAVHCRGHIQRSQGCRPTARASLRRPVHSDYSRADCSRTQCTPCCERGDDVLDAVTRQPARLEQLAVVGGGDAGKREAGDPG